MLDGNRSCLRLCKSNILVSIWFTQWIEVCIACQLSRILSVLLLELNICCNRMCKLRVYYAVWLLDPTYILDLDSMTSNGKLWRVSLCLCLRFHSLEHTCGFMYVLYMCCQRVVYTKLAGSMYDIHANEDICDFKRGVCHKPVILTNIFAVVFWRIISFFLKTLLGI